jgi:hypothetical protein
MSANVKTWTTWGRRLGRGPWHILAGHAPGGWRRTQCGRTLTGELERAQGPADGPDHDRSGSRSCPDCVRWATAPKGSGTVLWRSPSGRYHTQRMCSGGAGRRNRRVVLFDEQLAALEIAQPDGPCVCKCAAGVRDKARTRIENGYY